MGYLKKWCSHRNVRDKILIYSGLVSVLLITVFIWISNTYINWTLQKNIQNVTETNVGKVRDYFHNVEYTVSLSLFNIKNSLTVQDYLLGNSEPEEWVQGIVKDVANRECISVLELYDAQGMLRLCSSGEAASGQRLSQELMEILDSRGDKNYWSNQWSNSQLSEKLQVFRCLKKDNQVLGYVRVKIDDASLTDIFNYVGFNVSSEMCVLGYNGKLILPRLIDALSYRAVQNAYHNYSESGTEKMQYSYMDDKFTISCTELDDFGVIVVIITRTEDMVAELSMIQSMIYLTGGVCLILVVLVSVVLSSVVSAPLIRLTREIEQAGWDNLDLRVNEESYNEIGTLSRAFNQMLERAQVLMSEVEKAQKRKRELELSVLQMQITPHFLYNSLESLSALSLIGDNEIVYQMSKALGIFYRDVLSEGQDVISIEKEIDIVENYLFVQSIRYQDKFTYSVNVAPEIQNYQIVKLTLQPLVENAIYHGIREIIYPGFVEVTGRQEDGFVILQVKDNGKGMSKALQQLRTAKEPGENTIHRMGFGMLNVDERLKLYFGEEYGLAVYSEPGQGTCVEVRLPTISGGG